MKNSNKKLNYSACFNNNDYKHLTDLNPRPISLYVFLSFSMDAAINENYLVNLAEQ